jgi:hypothetical protein
MHSFDLLKMSNIPQFWHVVEFVQRLTFTHIGTNVLLRKIKYAEEAIP